MANVKKDKDMVKSRLVVLAKMFYALTDEEHTMTNIELSYFDGSGDIHAGTGSLAIMSTIHEGFSAGAKEEPSNLSPSSLSDEQPHSMVRTASSIQYFPIFI